MDYRSGSESNGKGLKSGAPEQDGNFDSESLSHHMAEVRKLAPDMKVNFDTNGYLTHARIRKVLKFTTSITYDIKAFNDEVILALNLEGVIEIVKQDVDAGPYFLF